MPKNSANSVKRGLGNTESKPPTKKQSNECKNYSFTKNDIPQNEEEAIQFYHNYSAIIKNIENIIYYIFQLELGEEDNRYHLQGYLMLSQKARFTSWKHIENGAHFDPAKGSKEANIKYCSKEETKIIGPTIWDKSKEPRYTAEQLMLIPYDDFKDWQREAIEIAKKPVDKRKIYWYWSSQGCMGKTEVVKHLIQYYNWGYVDGDKKSIMCAILGEKGDKEIKEGYVFNFGKDKDIRKISYTAMENIKDGLLFSSKYVSGGGLFPPAKIIVMANAPPIEDKLSADRWVIINVDNKPPSEEEGKDCIMEENSRLLNGEGYVIKF